MALFWDIWKVGGSQDNIKIQDTCTSSMEKQSTNHQLSLIHCIIQRPSRRQWVEGQGMENSQSHSVIAIFARALNSSRIKL